jgi:hypothetical protein
LGLGAWQALSKTQICNKLFIKSNFLLLLSLFEIFKILLKYKEYLKEYLKAYKK